MLPFPLNLLNTMAFSQNSDRKITLFPKIFILLYLHSRVGLTQEGESGLDLDGNS